MTNYHLVNDTWEASKDGIAYKFYYISTQKNGVYLRVKRMNEFKYEDIIDDTISIRHNNTFDYISENGIKANSYQIPGQYLILRMKYYSVGKDNVAEIFIHTNLDKFNGYVCAYVDDVFSVKSMQVLYLDLY